MEFRFELALCAALESPERVVSRQLGAGIERPGGRIVDVCLLEPGPAFAERTAITPERLPGPVVEAAIEGRLGPGRATSIREALDCSPSHARGVAEAAADAGFLELERREGRLAARTTTRYPTDWVGDLVAVENKPDLGTPGDLEAQLRYDAALGLFDRVVLATASYVTRAHLNRIPDAVGVWRFDPDTGEREVVREPTPLAPTEPGVEIRAEHPLRSDVSLVSPAAKARKRRRVAERAYEKGWRPDPPACAHATLTDDGRPRCAHFDRIVNPGRECGPTCEAYESVGRVGDGDGDRGDTLATLRDERSAWVASPEGPAPRRQSGLDRFG